MTFMEQHGPETAISSALREAGVDDEFVSLVAMINAHKDASDETLGKRIANDKRMLSIAVRILRRVASASTTRTHYQPRKAPQRNLKKITAPAAKERAAQIISDIGKAAVHRFLADYGSVHFREIDTYLRDSYVLRRIKEHYAGARPDQTIGEVVRSDVLARFIRESEGGHSQGGSA